MTKLRICAGLVERRLLAALEPSIRRNMYGMGWKTLIVEDHYQQQLKSDWCLSWNQFAQTLYHTLEATMLQQVGEVRFL